MLFFFLFKLNFVIPVQPSKTNESWSMKKGLNAFAKSIDSCQQSAQADMGRNFSLSLNFLHVTGPFCLTLTQTLSGFLSLIKKAFENIVGKGENADNHHFHLFPRLMFSSLGKTETRKY